MPGGTKKTLFSTNKVLTPCLLPTLVCFLFLMPPCGWRCAHLCVKAQGQAYYYDYYCTNTATCISHACYTPGDRGW